jgi:signal transduction histidine kinase
MASYPDGTHRFIFDGEEPDSENYTHIGLLEDVSAYGSAYMLAYETKTPQFTSMMHQLSWGRLVSAYMPILNSAGDVVGIIGVDFDGEDIYKTIISSLRLQIVFAVFFIAVGLLLYYFFLKDLSRQNKTLNKLNRSKIEFLQDMSHEMKAPLNVIATGIDYTDMQINKDNIDIQNTNAALERIRNASQRLGRMVDGMVNLAAISDTGANRQRLDFAALLKTAAEVFTIPVEKQNNILSVQIMPCLPDVYVDADRFTQVITNLLQNAAAHTQDGRITLAADFADAFITVSVTDTGSGIEPTLLPRLFHRGISGGGGTGFGLNLCKTIVEAHGGIINIESEQGKGTVVTFTVPVYGGQEAGRHL